MKIVIQRVKKASVIVTETGEISGSIDEGLLVLLGVKRGDTAKEADYLVHKLIKLRILADKDHKMNLSVVNTKSSILVVSQFTLHANTKDGNRPSFMDAETPDEARKLYEYFIEKLRQREINVQTGSFGNYMDISAIFDGPVTIIIES